jgi:hypothetical protein
MILHKKLKLSYMYDPYFKEESEQKWYKKRWLMVVVKYHIFWSKSVFD